MTPSVALVQRGAFKCLSPRGTGRPAGWLGAAKAPAPRHRPGIAPASPGLCHPQVWRDPALAALNASIGAAVPWHATKFGIRH